MGEYMKLALKYIFILSLTCILIVGGLYYYFYHSGYQVVFNSNGGSYVEKLRTGLDKKISAPEVPIKDGYEFLGWYYNDNLFDFDDTINSNITLEAKWQEIKEEEYILAFDSLGGTKIDNLNVLSGYKLENVPIPKKDGYEFLGWYYHNKLFDFDNEILTNMVFVAKYEKIED